MVLNGSTRRQLQDALVAAFPDRQSLAELLSLSLDVRLNEVVGEANLRTTAFQLIEWAESTGNLDKLVQDAIRVNPGNPKLRAFVAAVDAESRRAPAPATAARADASPAAGTILAGETVEAAKPAVASAPPGPATSPAAPPIEGPMHVFLAAENLAASPLVVTAVLLEEPDRIRMAVRSFIEDALHDPRFNGLPAVSGIRRRGLDYTEDDEEVRTAFIDRLTHLSFEAYVYFSKQADAGAFRETVTNLLTDRFTNERSRPFTIWIDRRLAARTAEVSSLAETSIAGIRRTYRKAEVTAEVAPAAPNEPIIAVAHYVGAIVRLRLGEPTVSEKRAFERLHPQKIRLIHEMGTSVFYRARHPLR